MGNSINYIVENILQKFIDFIVSILPHSPFLAYVDYFSRSKYLPYINYFVPIDIFIAILDLWLVAVAGYYVYKIVIKLLLAVSDFTGYSSKTPTTKG